MYCICWFMFNAQYCSVRAVHAFAVLWCQISLENEKAFNASLHSFDPCTFAVLYWSRLLSVKITIFIRNECIFLVSDFLLLLLLFGFENTTSIKRLFYGTNHPHSAFFEQCYCSIHEN